MLSNNDKSSRLISHDAEHARAEDGWIFIHCSITGRDSRVAEQAYCMSKTSFVGSLQFGRYALTAIRDSSHC